MSATALSSGVLVTGSTTTLATGRSYLNSVIVTGDGTNGGAATIYDNTAASGKIIAVIGVPATGVCVDANFSRAIRCDIGLTVAVSGTGANAYVNYGAA